MATENKEMIRELNQLLRGEISAAETYKQAMDKIDGDGSHPAEVEQLHAMQRDHGVNAQRIRERIEALGGEASDDSGAWGAFAQTVQGAASLLGDSAALKALKEGEEHGLKSFERKLNDGHLDPASASIVEAMIPTQKQHIARLDSMMRAS